MLIILQWCTIVIYTLSYHLKVAITVKNAAYKDIDSEYVLTTKR